MLNPRTFSSKFSTGLKFFCVLPVPTELIIPKSFTLGTGPVETIKWALDFNWGICPLTKIAGKKLTKTTQFNVSKDYCLHTLYI